MICRARIWLRVSQDHQDEDNQLAACERRVAYGDRGEPWAFDERTGIYRAHDVHGDDLEDATRLEAIADAKRGEYEVLVCWALDRWTRGGILTLLGDQATFRKAGARLISVQEDWADNQLLSAIAAWNAEQELTRIRERARATKERQRRQIEKQGYFVSKAGERVTTLGSLPAAISEEAKRFALDLRYQGVGWHAVAARAKAAGHGNYSGATWRRHLLYADPGLKVAPKSA